MVSPLLLLMKDQVANFGRRGVKCVLVAAKDRQVVQGIIAGDYQLVYLSPESLLCDEKLRIMLCSKVYIDNLVALAVDEAHCTAGDGERI